MNKRILGVLGDAMKVAIAVWGTFWLEKHVAAALPTVWEAVHFLIAAVISAVLLELLFQLALGWPRISIVWSVKDEDAPITEVVARVRKSTRQSQVFRVKISTPPGGWIGYQVFRGYMRLGVKLRISIENASVTPTREDSYKVAGVPTLQADDTTHGFVVDLGPAPTRAGPWHWADVRWRDDSTPTGDPFNIAYVFDHDNRLIKILLNCLIWRSKNARIFRVIGP